MENLTELSKLFTKKSGIYKITSPSGKIYIGQTSNLRKRYYYYLTGFNSIKEQTRLYNSFLKYGILNHIFEIIEECEIEKLDEREIYWGEFYDVLGKNGLVCRLGNGKGKCSEETKQKMITKLTGRKQSKETIEKRIKKLKGRIASKEEKENKSKSKLEYFKNNEFTWGNKISESKKEKTNNEFLKKSVLQYDLKGNFIQEWPSIKEASIKLEINNGCISANLKGRQKRAGKYIFKYKN
jgi:group I intron endonuclease